MTLGLFSSFAVSKTLQNPEKCLAEILRDVNSGRKLSLVSYIISTFRQKLHSHKTNSKSCSWYTEYTMSILYAMHKLQRSCTTPAFEIKIRWQRFMLPETERFLFSHSHSFLSKMCKIMLQEKKIETLPHFNRHLNRRLPKIKGIRKIDCLDACRIAWQLLSTVTTGYETIAAACSARPHGGRVRSFSKAE